MGSRLLSAHSSLAAAAWGLSALLLAGCAAPTSPERVLPAPSPPLSPPASPAASPPASASPEVLTAPLSPPAPGWRSLRSPSSLGLPAVYEYVNEREDDCGQAAAATLLATRDAAIDPDLARELTARFPPDLAAGALGSSPRRVREMISLPTEELRGLSALEAALAEGRAVLVLLDLSLIDRGLSAHWSVVVALDPTHVQLTNLAGGRLSREQFVRAWSGPIPTLAGVSGTGLALAGAGPT